MLFSTPIFLFLFLPICLVTYFIIKDEYRNIFLLLASLIFYAWGEPVYILLMLLSTAFNYVAGLAVDRYNGKKIGKAVLALGIVANILFLVYYKYFNFLVEMLNQITGLQLETEPIALPLGISFYTFHSLSYIIDIHRKIVTPQRNILNLGLYISFFPQLVAGPIIRYKDIYQEIEKREATFTKFTDGAIRFTIGLAKKVLLANTFGSVADKIFDGSYDQLGIATGWTGIVMYTLQIFFDFSGYSDMAIGLGKMFGFHIKENFNLPYIAENIRDFWRRWHISLSSWFRDYLYIPLGGSHVTTWKIYRNLLIVFFVTGLWHGASLSFIFWGLFHGVFLVLERGKWGNFIDRAPVALRHTYTLLVVMVGWVFFRVPELSQATNYIGVMFGSHAGIDTPAVSYLDYWDTKVALCFIFGVMFSTDLPNRASAILSAKPIFGYYWRFALTCSWLLILLLSIASIAAQTYNPFIYFRF